MQRAFRDNPKEKKNASFFTKPIIRLLDFRQFQEVFSAHSYDLWPESRGTWYFLVSLVRMGRTSLRDQFAVKALCPGSPEAELKKNIFFNCSYTL